MSALLSKRTLKQYYSALLILMLSALMLPLNTCISHSGYQGAINDVNSAAEPQQISNAHNIASPSTVPLYVVGTLNNLNELQGTINLGGGRVIHIGISMLKTLHTLPSRLGVIVIARLLSPLEEKVLERCFLRGFVVVSLGRAVHNQVNNVLSRIATVVTNVNGTELYIYKLVGKHAINGHYPVLVAGYAGKDLTGELLKDAIIALSMNTNDWRIVAFVNWSSEALWKPYGKLNVMHVIYRYPQDPWRNMDLYAVKCVTQIVSGNKLGWEDNGYTWFNDFIKSKYMLRYYTSIYGLVDYDPSSSSGGGSIEVSLSFPPALALTWSYSGNYILSIDDDSDLDTSVAGWVHDIGTWYSLGVSNTIKIAPGFEYTVSPVKPGTQRWVISGGWVGAGLNPGAPLGHFTGTVVIIVKFT